ncbi:MAG: hypothetical protein IPK00_18035 [Deltaproteobacteria bacterium]|nr:hypothetical protein [Deltaproteobacteria bacterium]
MMERAFPFAERAFAVALVVALTSAAAWTARAEEPYVDAPLADESADLPVGPGWEPQLTLGFGVLTQPHKGEAVVPTETGTTTLSDSGDSLISQHFKFGLELLTPVELAIPTRPRLVLRSSLNVPISRGLISDREDVQYDTGTPGFDDNCPSTVGNPPGPTATCSIRLRNRTSVDYIWTAGLGVDFTLPFDQQQFHFMQGFEYIGMAAQAEGTYLRRTSPRSSTTESEAEYIDVKGDRELYHGISITETFSVDAYQQGPLRFGFFLEGRMSWFATDRDMSASGSSPRGTFQFVSSLNDPEPIQYQVLGGVSVRFDPRLR